MTSYLDVNVQILSISRLFWSREYICNLSSFPLPFHCLQFRVWLSVDPAIREAKGELLLAIFASCIMKMKTIDGNKFDKYSFT